MGEIQKFDSNTALTKELPRSGDIIVMDALEGWSELQEEQRAYLSTYFDTFPKKIKACMESGIGTSRYREWSKNDEQFINIMKLIEFIHVEELKGIDYAEAYTDSQTRARFLKQIEDKKSEKKVTNNNLNIEVKGMNDAMEVLDELSNN